MKIDREYYEGLEFRGEKEYEFVQIGANVGAYVNRGFHEIWFEIDSLEIIGTIHQDDVRTSWNRYYTAKLSYGWNGSKKTKKEFVKTLCTRADYTTAVSRMKEACKNIK